MAYLKVYTICANCNGDGLQPTEGPHGGPGADIACTWPGCNGTGSYEIGWVDMDPQDLHDKHQDILDKLDDIIEMLTP